MSVESRLAKIEAAIDRNRPRPLIVRAKLPGADAAQEMTVERMIETSAEWTRVTGGNSLNDLDRLLNHIRERAMK